MFDRFNDLAQKAITRARIHAQNLRHDFIGTEHILLGLLDQQNSKACDVIKSFGINSDSVRKEVTKNILIGPELVGSGVFPFTPRTKKALAYATGYANKCGHNYIGTCHLLYGLIRENDGFAAQVLIECGLHLKEVDRQIRTYEKFSNKESLKEDDIHTDMPIEAVMEAEKNPSEEKRRDSPKLTFADLLIGQKFILHPSEKALNKAVLLIKVYNFHVHGDVMRNAICVASGDYEIVHPATTVIRII